MITLIGTGHIFDLSAALTDVLDEQAPDVIGVELDPQRYQALAMKKQNPEALKQSRKNLPLVYKLLARFQDSMAQEYGVSAGDEMMTALSYAQSHGIPAQLIDTNAQQLFITMWKQMPFMEKFRLLFSGFGGFFISKNRVEKELKDVQENFDDYIEQIGEKFPTIKKTLIDDRNEHMLRAMLALDQQYDHTVVCLGDGHIPGISLLLDKQKIAYEAIRLSQLRSFTPKEKDSASASFSIHYKSQ